MTWRPNIGVTAFKVEGHRYSKQYAIDYRFQLDRLLKLILEKQDQSNNSHQKAPRAVGVQRRLMGSRKGIAPPGFGDKVVSAK